MATVVRPEQPAAAPPMRAAGGRRAYVDRLKVGIVAAIIVGHGLLGYTGLDGAWPYQPYREVKLAEATDILFLALVVFPGTLFVMGLLFLVSGLLTPGSASRKGPGRFATDRLLRLGAPFAVWVLVLWPLFTYLMKRIAGEGEPFRAAFMDAVPFLDTGPMWFVEVLLLYSLAYAAWVHVRGPGPSLSRAPGPVSVRSLMLLTIAVALSTVVIRLAFPYNTMQVAHLNLWEWPQYVAMFGLGIVAARQGWLDHVPDNLVRVSRTAALVGLASAMALAAVIVLLGNEPDVLSERWHWTGQALAVIEAPVAVGASVWLLAVAQRRLVRSQGRLARALARSAYAAFILQGPVLIGLALALRPFDLPAEVKAFTVAGVGLAASFALAWVVVARTPLRRVL